MRKFRIGRHPIGICCLLAFVAAATVAYAEDAAPAVSAITFHDSPARGDTYERGERVQVEVRFDRAVKATGSLQVALTVGTQTRHATYSGWGGLSLYFDYTVQERDRDADGISIAANALSLNGGTIRAADGTTEADLTHGAVASWGRHKVNGTLASPPVVSNIFFRSPANGDTYELGETIDVRVDFHRAVTVTGSPQVALTIGTQTRHAAYTSSWRDGRILTFSYAVQDGDRDADGIVIRNNALALNGGTIKSADGAADAVLTHAPHSHGRSGKVDGSLVTIPVVKSISLISFPARGDTYELGETVEVKVDFDGAVKTTGNPQVALTVGTRSRYAIHHGWGRDFLLFDYIVQAGDRDEDGISIAANALVLGGGSIKAADGVTDADLTHPEVGADLTHAAVTPLGGGKVNGSRDVTPPRVTNISFISSPTRGGAYQLGETVEVVVEFDGAVKATSDPQRSPVGTCHRDAEAVRDLLGMGQRNAVFRVHRAGG